MYQVCDYISCYAQVRPVILCVSGGDEERHYKRKIMCGNHSLGRTMVEYCLTTSLPGMRYLVTGEHVMERIVWGMMVMASIFLALYCCIYKYVITAQPSTTSTTLPPLIICPPYTPDLGRVQRTLPVMETMWELWDTVRRGETQQEDMPWRNESHAVRKFFNKVMYEGGKMAMDDCEDIIETCHGEKGSKDCCQHSEKVYTKAGLCLQISQTPTTRKDDQVGFKKDFLQIHNLLPVSMRLNMLDSVRIGHPVLSLPYWGETYLCDDQWGQEEAAVICRGLGFNNGKKFYQSKPSTGKISFGQYFGKFNCTGSEDSLLDCPRTEFAGCDVEEKISSVMCDVGGLHGVHMRTKTKGYPYLQGTNGEEYFCKDSFGSLEASVFCRMLSWKTGKVTLVSDGDQLIALHTPKCEGKLL